MKKFFWLVVIILLLITFSDHHLLRPYKEQLVDLLVDYVAIGVDDKEAGLRKTRKELQQLAEQWGDSQRNYIDKAATSAESLLKFRRDYCINKDFNPILFGEPLTQVCAIINTHQQMLAQP